MSTLRPHDRVLIDHDVPAMMRDGAVLQADVIRPETAERCPVLLCRTPYGKQDAAVSAFLDGIHAARHGFIVAVQDVRGRGRSDGHWQPFVNEFTDGDDSVRWAAELPGSDGNVGMFGSSYLGYTQWAAATQRPDALRAIAPALTWSDARNGLLERGGTVESGFMSYLHHYGFADASPDPDKVDALAVTAAGTPDLEAVLTGVDPCRCSIPIDSRDPAGHLPALNIAGWYDVFLAGSIDHFLRAQAAASSSSRLIVGPWSHVNFTGTSGTYGFGERAALERVGGTGLQALTIEWFDHWLRGEPVRHPWLTGPAVHAFDMGSNRWIAHDTWPPPGAHRSWWAVDRSGTLEPSAPTNRPHEPLLLSGAGLLSWWGGTVHMHPSQPAGVIDQRTRLIRSGEQHFTSAHLSAALTVAGPVSVHIDSARADPPIDLVARLSVIHRDGFERNLVDGVRRVGTRRDERDIVIDLWSTYNTFQPGERLRLTLSVGGWPRWGHAPEGRSTVRLARVALSFMHV